MSEGHISALVFITAWTVAVCLVMNRRRNQGKTAAKLLGLLMVFSELLRDSILLFRGEFSTGYLPLHLCSFCMGLCLIYGFFREERGAILCLVGLPGSISALLFPNWSDLPLFHFISLHGYFFHALLLQGSLMPLITGELQLEKRDFWRAEGFLVLAACGVAPCNLLLHTNYMFLRWPSTDSPLEHLARIPGRFGYQTGLLILASGVLFLTWKGIILLQRSCKIDKDF